MRIRTASVLFAALALLTIAGTASAQGKAGGMGAAGQIAISSDLELSFKSTSYKAAQGEDPKSETKIVLRPALDYFVAESISIGGFLQYSTEGNEEKSTGKLTTIGIGPRVGYYLPLTEQVGFWPKLGITYASWTQKATTTTPAGSASHETTGSTMQFNIYAPITFSPAPHFFIGLGPKIDMDLSSKYKPEGGDSTDADKTTSIGVASTVGGYF